MRTIEVKGGSGWLFLALLLTSSGFRDAPIARAQAEERLREESPESPDGSDWPGFLGPSGDNKSPETGLLDDWPEAGPPALWRRQLGTGYGGPSIADGKLFIFDRHGGQARLSCLESTTGKEIWRFEYPTDYVDLYGYNDGPRSTPLVDGDRVYIHGVEGVLHCVDIATGQPRWKVDTASRFGVVQNFFGVGSSPVVEGELLIVQVGGSPPDSPSVRAGGVVPNGSGIVAFEKQTGEVVYETADELASYSSPCLATIDGRRWCFLFARGGLVGFEPSTGKVDFHYPWRDRQIESVNAANPVVVGDLVFISECYGPGSSLLRVRPGGYDVVWRDPPGRRKAMMAHWNTPIHLDGHVYGCSGRHAGEAELRCIELRTGQVKWSRTGWARSTLIFVDRRLLALTERGTLLLIRPDPKTFDLIASRTPRDAKGRRLLEYPVWAPPVLSHGLLYVRSKDRLVCIDLREGSSRRGPPVVAPGSPQ